LLREKDRKTNDPNVPRAWTGLKIAVWNSQICPNLKWSLLSTDKILPVIWKNRLLC
jgi:hypothetical protein